MKKITAIVGGIAALSGAAYAGHRISRYQDRETTVYLAETAKLRSQVAAAQAKPATLADIYPKSRYLRIRTDLMVESDLDYTAGIERLESGNYRLAKGLKKELFIPCLEINQDGSSGNPWVVHIRDEEAVRRYLVARKNLKHENPQLKDHDIVLGLDWEAARLNPTAWGHKWKYPVEPETPTPFIEFTDAATGKKVSNTSPVVAVYETGNPPYLSLHLRHGTAESEKTGQ